MYNANAATLMPFSKGGRRTALTGCWWSW